MMLNHRPLLGLCALPATMLAALPAARAAPGDDPDRAIKLALGFLPGTGPDTVARTVGQRLGQVLKASLAVDNRAGADGQIAAQAVAKSAAGVMKATGFKGD